RKPFGKQSLWRITQPTGVGVVDGVVGAVEVEVLVPAPLLDGVLGEEPRGGRVVHVSPSSRASAELPPLVVPRQRPAWRPAPPGGPSARISASHSHGSTAHRRGSTGVVGNRIPSPIRPRSLSRRHHPRTKPHSRSTRKDRMGDRNR